MPSPMKKRDSMLVSARTPRSTSNRTDSADKVMSGSTTSCANNQSRSGFTFEGR